MSVIAKLEVRNKHEFGVGVSMDLSCVCEDDLMAEYADSEEDRLFTKYSPWGEARLAGHSSKPLSDLLDFDKFYVMIVHEDELERNELPDAALAFKAHCVSLTDFGDGQAQQVMFGHHGNHAKCPVTSFSWRMSVDNPGATKQFKPGCGRYWIGFYPAGQFTRDSAIKAAHS